MAWYATYTNGVGNHTQSALLVTWKIEEDERVENGLPKANAYADEKATEHTLGTIIFDRLELEKFCPNEDGEVSFLRSGFQKWGEPIAIKELRPWNELDRDIF